MTHNSPALLFLFLSFFVTVIAYVNFFLKRTSSPNRSSFRRLPCPLLSSLFSCLCPFILVVSSLMYSPCLALFRLPFLSTATHPCDVLAGAIRLVCFHT